MLLLSAIDECLSGPCENLGVCVDAVNGYTCACQPGYTGGHCQTGTSRQILPLAKRSMLKSNIS